MGLHSNLTLAKNKIWIHLKTSLVWFISFEFGDVEKCTHCEERSSSRSNPCKCHLLLIIYNLLCTVFSLGLKSAGPSGGKPSGIL